MRKVTLIVAADTKPHPVHAMFWMITTFLQASSSRCRARTSIDCSRPNCGSFTNTNRLRLGCTNSISRLCARSKNEKALRPVIEEPQYYMQAEREGFEPSVPFRVHSISSAAQSTALPPLQKEWPMPFLTHRQFQNAPAHHGACGCHSTDRYHYSAASVPALRAATSSLFFSITATAFSRREIFRQLAESSR